MFSIYLVTNKINGKVYVGKTLWSISDRWLKHVKDSESKRAQCYFWRAIKKHGSGNFKVECVNTTDSEKHANWLESLYIGLTRSHISKFGYNSTMGGDGVILNAEQRAAHLRKMGTPEVRARASAAKIGKKNPCFGRRGMLNPRFGMRHSEATKTRISTVKRRPLDMEKMQAMRTAGSTYQEIADTVFVSIGTAYRRLNAA